MGRRFNEFKAGMVEGLKSWPYIICFSLGFLGGGTFVGAFNHLYNSSPKTEEALEQRTDFNEEFCRDVKESYREIIKSQYESARAADGIEKGLQELERRLDHMGGEYRGTPGLPGKTGIGDFFDGKEKEEEKKKD